MKSGHPSKMTPCFSAVTFFVTAILLLLLGNGAAAETTEESPPSIMAATTNTGTPTTTTTNATFTPSVPTIEGLVHPTYCSVLPELQNGPTLHTHSFWTDVVDAPKINRIEKNCAKFSPYAFFQGIAKDYLPDYANSAKLPSDQRAFDLILDEGRRDSWKPRPNQKEYTPLIPKHIQRPDTCPNTHMEDFELPPSITIIHILKCGGTTVYRSLVAQQMQLPYKFHSYNQDQVRKDRIMERVYKDHVLSQRPDLQIETVDPVVAAFLRDPVIRFLSSVGQLLHMENHQKQLEVLNSSCDVIKANKNWLSDQQRRLKENPELVHSDDEEMLTTKMTQALLQCVLHIIQSPIDDKPEIDDPATEDDKHPRVYNYMEQHFTPQAYQIRSRTLGLDIPITLMDMKKHISPTLAVLLGKEQQEKNPNAHHRKSRVKKYTQGFVLEPSMLTPSLVEQICKIYSVDVMLLHTVGIIPTLCDDIDFFRNNVNTIATEDPDISYIPRADGVKQLTHERADEERRKQKKKMKAKMMQASN